MKFYSHPVSVVTLLAILFLASPAMADDTAFGGSGSAPMPIGQSEIEMVSERVSIKGSSIGDPQWGGTWNVECEFVFRNTVDRPIRLNVGFPFPIFDEEHGADAVIIHPRSLRSSKNDGVRTP